MKRVDSILLNELITAASVNARRRQHRNFHENHDDPCQRLFVAIMPDSYIQPHRHLVYPKDELFVVIQGKVAVIFFSEDGEVESTFVLAANSQSLGCEIPAGAWHTVIALEESIFLEVKAGPYFPLPEEDRASWAPSEGSDAAHAYLERLRAGAMSFTG
jgi:cupin fold WbuC family metalloprotein